MSDSPFIQQLKRQLAAARRPEAVSAAERRLEDGIEWEKESLKKEAARKAVNAALADLERREDAMRRGFYGDPVDLEDPLYGVSLGEGETLKAVATW